MWKPVKANGTNRWLLSSTEWVNISIHRMTRCYRTACSRTPNALYHIVVNHVKSADLAFQDGLYAGDFAFYVAEDGQPVTIGVRKDSLVANDWTIFDNFKLVYYGDGTATVPRTSYPL